MSCGSSMVNTSLVEGRTAISKLVTSVCLEIIAKFNLRRKRMEANSGSRTRFQSSVLSPWLEDWSRSCQVRRLECKSAELSWYSKRDRSSKKTCRSVTKLSAPPKTVKSNMRKRKKKGNRLRSTGKKRERKRRAGCTTARRTLLESLSLRALRSSISKIISKALNAAIRWEGYKNFKS